MGRINKTMNDAYNDGSMHQCCPICGMCVTCGDCCCQGWVDRDTNLSCSDCRWEGDQDCPKNSIDRPCRMHSKKDS